MAANIKFEVVTPEKHVVNEEAQIVIAPGSMGEFGILIGHTPFMTTLKTGMITYKDHRGVQQYVFISSGYAEALPDKVTILAESAEKSQDIDLARAEAALERSQRRLSNAETQDIDFVRVKAALHRALYRIKIAGLRA